MLLVYEGVRTGPETRMRISTRAEDAALAVLRGLAVFEAEEHAKPRGSLSPILLGW